MKKALLSIAVIITLAVSAPAAAVDMSVGAATWFTWWSMDSSHSTDDYDPTFMYGPVLSFGFSKKWSLSSIFLYGRFSGESSSSDIERFDSDTTLNYSINRFIKIFGGAKVMGFTQPDFSHISAGPALGVGLTLPLGGNFFVLANVSGMYNYAWQHENSVNLNAVVPGVNTTLSLAYYIEKASTTITLGGRFQYFHISYDDLPSDYDMDHYFYGATLSAVYSFGL